MESCNHESRHHASYNCDVLLATVLASKQSNELGKAFCQNSNQPNSVGHALKVLATEIDRGLCRFVLLLAEFDRSEYWRETGYSSCISWLNNECGISPSAAYDRKRVAYALEYLPVIKHLFVVGELSWSKVRALTRIATAENEKDLAASAMFMSASEIERSCLQFRDDTTPNNTEAEELRAAKQYEDRYISYRYDHKGMVSINASLPPLEGAAVLKSLARAEDELFEDGYAQSHQHLRADAFCLMAQKHLASESISIRTADRYQVIVHVDSAAMGQQAFAKNAFIENGPTLSPGTVKRLTSDCTMTPLLMAHGEPLSIGRKSRVWSTAITRAIVARDCHCQFPGCTASRHTQIHHIKHWSHGGETSVENGVLLCAFHHRQLHENKLAIERTPLDTNGKLPCRSINIDGPDGETIQLKAKLRRFRVKKRDGSYLE